MTTTRPSTTRAGGMAFFEALVGRVLRGRGGRIPSFGRSIRRPISRPAQRRLTLFLAQYWGGPRTYDDERGHPRLRMRHAPFAIDGAARDRWLVHMRAALVDRRRRPTSRGRARGVPRDGR